MFKTVTECNESVEMLAEQNKNAPSKYNSSWK